MNRTVIGIFGFILLVMAIVIPFLGLEQSKGDVLPLLIAFLVVLASGAFFVLALKPTAFKGYLIAVAALLVVLISVGVAGFLHHSAPQERTAIPTNRGTGMPGDVSMKPKPIRR